MTFKITLAAISLLLLAGIWWLLQLLDMPPSFSTQAIADWLTSEGALGPLLLMLLMVMAVVIGPIPTLPISAASGLAYGVLPGTAIAATGALAGAVLAFWLARLLGRDTIQRRFPDNPVLARNGSQRMLTLTIFLTRLIPVFSFALISYGAGVTTVTTWRFAGATLVGMLPMTFVFAGLGQTLELHPGLTITAGALVLVVMVSLPWALSRHPNSALARRLGFHPQRRK